MKLPPILQGESLTRLLQGAVGGAVITMIAGFSWGGWQLGSTAEKTADQRASNAVVAALAPICVDNFRHGADATAKLVAMKKIELLGSRQLRDQGRLGDVPRQRAQSRGRGGLRQDSQRRKGQVSRRKRRAAANSLALSSPFPVCGEREGRRSASRGLMVRSLPKR